MAIGKTNVGGGSGGTLTVTAPAGCTVTVSKDGKTKTKTAGTDGVAVFKGLDTGEWTVTITDGADSSAIDVMIYNDTSVYISSNSYCGSNPGAGANFSVNGYASEEKLLADAPNENTIGVVTDTAVPKWGFYASEPEVPAEGEIFFTVATESAGSFNALKKNALTVYPTLCQQSASGEWVRKAAYIYKDGAWVQFSYDRNYIFKEGYGPASAWYKRYGGGGYHIGNDYLGSDTSGTIVSTVDNIDFAKIRTLYVDASAGLTNGGKINITNKQSLEVISTLIITGTVRDTYTLDVSKISGSHIIDIEANIYNGKLKVYNIWSEE